MDIAALVSFALLLAGWIAAPDRPRLTELPGVEEPAAEAQPVAA